MTNVDSVEGEFEVQQQLVENFNKSSFSFECKLLDFNLRLMLFY